ncbi:hypothetical protein HG531_011416 [Fusarium graminearum]|nr:hypothetical protein HG531_011416 [Fusarium graminearum]
MATDCGEGLLDSRRVEELPVRFPFVDSDSSSRAIFESNGNGDSKDSSHDANKTNPGKPSYLAQGSDARKGKGENSGDCNKNGGACGVFRDGVETDRDTQHGRARDKNPVWE